MQKEKIEFKVSRNDVSKNQTKFSLKNFLISGSTVTQNFFYMIPTFAMEKVSD